MAKRSSGEGALFFDEAKQLWIGQLPRDERGRRPKVSAKTRQEAAWKLRKALRDRERGLEVISERTRLGDYLDGWLDDVVRPRVAAGKLAPTSAVKYESHVRLYLKPRLGRVVLGRLRPSQVERLLNELQSEGLSAATAVRVRATLSKALTDAMRDGIVDRNVAQIAEAPSAQKRAPSVFSEAEMRALVSEAWEDRLGMLYLFIMLTGLRVSEALNMRWSWIDFNTGTFRAQRGRHRVAHAAARVVGETGQVESKPKTEQSGDALPLSVAAAEVLVGQRRRQEAEGVESEWVFTTIEGRPLTYSTVLHAWQRLLARAEVPYKAADGHGRGLHELRRTFATTLRSAGVPLEEVQRLGRWASPSVLLAHYSAVDEVRLRRAVETLGQLLPGEPAVGEPQGEPTGELLASREGFQRTS